MIQLSTFLWMMIGLFAVVGFLRGWTKEIVATAGIILAFFALWQVQAILLEQLKQSASPDQKFFFYTPPFLLLNFFSSQNPRPAGRAFQWAIRANHAHGV